MRKFHQSDQPQAVTAFDDNLNMIDAISASTHGGAGGKKLGQASMAAGGV